MKLKGITKAFQGSLMGFDGHSMGFRGAPRMFLGVSGTSQKEFLVVLGAFKSSSRGLRRFQEWSKSFRGDDFCIPE